MTNATSNEVGTRIRTILSEHGRLSGNADSISEDADLYQAGMTSHASVNVMLALESAFDIEFPDAMLRRSAFASITAIRTGVEQLLAGR